MGRDERWEAAAPAHGGWRRLGVAASLLLTVVVLGSLLRVTPRSPDRFGFEPVGLPVAVGPPPRPSHVFLQRAHPATLGGLPPGVPVTPGAWAVASSDGRLVAVSGEAGFTVYESATLAVHAVLERTLPGRVTAAPHFTPKNDALVLRRGLTLFHRPLDPGRATAVTTLPAGVVVTEVVPLRDARAAVYAAGGRVLVADLRAGRVVVDLQLAPLGSPGLGWDVDNDLLYIAHAGGVTVVDLAVGAVVAQRVDAPIAGDPAVYQAAVSPDGTRLYVTGARAGVTLGLEVIDTASLESLTALALPVASVTVSPDGNWLALGGGGSGVMVLRAGETEVYAAVGDPDSEPLGFDPSSSLLYVAGRRLQVLNMTTDRVVASRPLPDNSSFLPSAAVVIEPS